EDSAPTREGLTVLLQQEGYRAIPAADGQEALSLIQSAPPPDLILLDMLMPVLDGWHFLERLRRDSPKPPIPVIVTTGTVLSREWAEAHGCAGFVKKPIEPEDLLAEIKRCLA